MPERGIRPICVALLAALAIPATASAQKLVTAPGPGGPPSVRVLDATGTDRSFLAYDPAFAGGVRVALGDVNGDGVLDVITGPGPGGGPHVRVWDGVTLTEIAGFFAYNPAFSGGVFVAAGDVNGDGRADIITGAGPGGGPHVRVWDGATFTEIGGFFAYNSAFPGGVNVAAGDVNGDGLADIVTGAGPGGGPHVRVWDGGSFTEIGGFFAYNSAFPGGVNVAAGDVDGDGLADIITGAGPGGGPHVRVWNGATFTEIGGFFAYGGAFPGGVVVGTTDLDRDGVNELVTAPAEGMPIVRLWSGTTFTLFGEYLAYDPAGGGSGVFIGSVAENPSQDDPPRVTATTPVNGATGIAVDADLTVTFSEAVTTGVGAFVLECPSGTAIPLTIVTASPATTFTLHPTSPLPLNTSCTLRIVRSEIADEDTDDPPDAMTADAIVSFTTTACAAIVVSPTTVTGGNINLAYAPVQFTQTGGTAPITWSITSGTLPAGMNFSAAGVLDGTPTQAGAFPLTITATAAGGCTGSVSFTLNIASAPNVAPSFVAGANQTVLEDAGAQSVAGWATAISPGPPSEAAQVVTFVITNNTNTALFSTQPAVASNGTLTYTPAANANGIATITLVLQDNGGTAAGGVDTSAPQSFTITVTAVNDAPSFTAGPNQTVIENAGPQTVASWATAISAGPADEAAQTLTFNVTGNTNTALFSTQPAVASDGTLTYTPAAFASGIATITLVLQDNGGTADGGVDLSAPVTFTVTVTPVNDPPMAVNDSATTDEDTVLTVPAPGVLGNDVDLDLGDMLTVSAVNGAPANVGTPLTLASGAVVTVNADGSYVYDPTGVAAFQALGQGQTATDSFTYTIQDSGLLSSSATVTITINGVNDVPALDLDLDDDGGTPPVTGTGFAITFAEGGPPTFIQDEADATITDVDSANLTSITVTITNVLDNLQEKLDVDLVTGGFNANFTKSFDETTTPGVAVLTITATTPQPLASFNTLLRRVTYQNIDTGADTSAPRTITFVVNDGAGNSNTATTTVTITATDDPPTADNDSYSVAEGATLTVPAPGVLDGDTDPEGDTPITALLVTGPTNATSFTLNPDGSFTYTHNGSETITDSFTYRAVANGLQSAVATVTITITPVNDPPAITAGGTLTFTEGNPATAIDTTITVSDADDTNLESATVQITANYVNGQDILAMPVTAGITSSFNALTGTLTLTGSATVAAYQAALRTVTYFNTSNNPSTLPRTVSWIVNDGTSPSNTATSTITVTSVNSAPVGGIDAWETFGNTELRVGTGPAATPHVLDATPANGVLANDTDPEGNPIAVTGLVGAGCGAGVFTCATAGGGTVTIQANGTFSYTPQAGDVTSDSFQYIATDTPSAGLPASVMVTVNLTLHGRIWYVNGTVAGPGTGTSSNPFSALPATVGDADDFIFVHNSTVSGGITLQNGQKLYGEGFGLSIDQALNGNPAPAVLVAPGTRPVINATTGNAVGVLANTASGSLANVEIRGLALATTAATSNAIDVTTADAANVAVTISDVVVNGATAEGIDINQASSGTATVSISNVTVTSTGTGIDLNETAGAMTVTGFSGITITGDTGGSGIAVTNATFDATAGGAYNQVAGGTTAVGTLANPVGLAGVVLTSVSGDLAFADLDIFTTNGAALLVSGTGAVNAALGTGTLVSVASNVATLQSTGGPVVGVNNATADLPLASASVTSSPTTGIILVNVASGTTTASVSAPSGSIANTTGISVDVQGGTVSLNYGGNITKANSFAMVSVSGGHTTGTITFSGTLNATAGPGLVFDNADSTTSYNFTGTTTLNGGDAGIDILNGSSGTFTFGTGTTITNPTGTAFFLSGSNANVTYSGSISDNTGFAVDITGHAAGTVTFQTGSITSTGTGLQVSNNTGGTINFNSPTIALTTGANKAVTLDVGNAGGTISFNPGGGGTGLDISTTTGTGFSALGGGTISVQGTGNSITSTGGTAIDVGSTIIGASGLTFGTTSSGGGANGVKLASATGGAISLGTGTLAGATSATFLVGNGAGGANTGGTSAITYGGTITAPGTARAVDIQDRSAGAGSITLSGTITRASGSTSAILLDGNAAGTIAFSGPNSVLNGGTATAVSLTSNTGATINFTGGGLDIDATSGGGFHATGGGTVTVTGTGNTIGTTTGTALNVVNVNIGAADLTFESISKNGTGTGIVLNNTGAAGSLTVTGDSGSANNNSGGTIQNATIGISLTDTRDVVLDQMNIHDMTQNGIDGFHVTNFTLTNSRVETTGTASIAGDYEVNAISFMDRSGANDNTIDGTITITGNTITNPERNAISIETWAGTISNVNISNNTISGGTTTARIQDAVHVFAQGTTGGITTGTISNNAISDFRFFDTAPVIDIFVGGNGIRLVTDTNAVNPASTLGTTPNPFVISDNDIDNVGSNMIAVTAVGRTASANVRILNNGTLGDPMNNAEGLGISLFFGGNGTFNGLIHNNVLQNIDQGANPSGSSGIGVQSDFGGNTGANTDVTNSNITVTNNRVTNMAGNGIIATGINNAGTFNIRINDNIVTSIPDLVARFGIRVGHSNIGTQPTINLEMHGNDTAGGNPVIGPPDGIGIRQQTGFTFCIEGISPSPANATQAATYVNSQNAGETTTVLAGNNFTNCSVPDSPTALMAAGGEAPSVVHTDPLSASSVAPVLLAARERWRAAGLTAEERRTLDAIAIEMTDLPGAMVGEARGSTIALDRTAAGWGWFVDPTPLDDAEFGEGTATGAAADRIDLLTTVAHEMLHVLGRADLDAELYPHDVMARSLPRGVRRVPWLTRPDPGFGPVTAVDPPRDIGSYAQWATCGRSQVRGR